MTKKRNILRTPRNLELLLYISKHEGVCASELSDAGFTKPQVYVMLGVLTNYGLVRAMPLEVKTGHGVRLRRVFHLTDSGKAVASRLREIEQVIGRRFDGRE